jgi:hypothetical protein
MQKLCFPLFPKRVIGQVYEERSQCIQRAL